jgi:hypothetical protein
MGAACGLRTITSMKSSLTCMPAHGVAVACGSALLHRIPPPRYEWNGTAWSVRDRSQTTTSARSFEWQCRRRSIRTPPARPCGYRTRQERPEGGGPSGKSDRRLQPPATEAQRGSRGARRCAQVDSSSTSAVLSWCLTCDAMRCDAMRCDAMRCDAMRCHCRDGPLPLVLTSTHE